MKTTKTLLSIVLVLFATVIYAQDKKVNVEKSVVKWEGKKIGGAHDGHIKFKEGMFTVKDNKIASGTFIIDMTSMTNSDIESEEYRKKIIAHLKSDDFFGVDKYPTSKLEIKESSEFKNGKAKVMGHLTIKKDTHPIEFEVTKMGDEYKTMLTIDRAKYDVRYGSKSFFNNLGDKVIYDDFTLDISLVAN